MTKSYEFPNWLSDDSEVVFSDSAKTALINGKLKFSLKKHGAKLTICRLDCYVDAVSGNINIHVGNDNASIKIGKVKGFFDFRLWRDSIVSIGDGTTCNGARVVCDNSSVTIGDDCLFSDEIILQSADQHAIVDLKTGVIANTDKTAISIGNHVWIGRRSNILYGANIGGGSIVGFGTLANKKFPANSLIVGVPGKVKKSDISWSRSQTNIDEYAKKLIEEFNS